MPKSRSSLPRRSSMNVVLSYFGFAFLYVVMFQISNIFPTTDLRATPWNPEAGVVVAAGALVGWAAVPIMFISNLSINLYDGAALTPKWLVLSSFANTLIFAGPAVLLRKWTTDLANPTTSIILRFIGFVALITIAATIARMLIVAVAFNLSPSFLFPYLVTLTVGNLIGILTVTPLFYTGGTTVNWLGYFRSFNFSHYLTVAAIFLCSIGVFGLKQTDEFKFFYLVFIPVVAFSIRDGFRGAVFSILLSDVLMIIILLWRNFEASTATELQLLMISLSATGLILGATVSERKTVSEALLESHLRFQESQTALLQATRLSLASEMAAALAHELNQPLSAIRNFIRTVRRKLSQPRLNRLDLFTDIDAAVAQVDSASNLIKSTRDFIKRGDVTFAAVDIVQCLTFSLKLVDRELRSARINLTVTKANDVPLVLGNEQQIQQVLINLVRNSKEAILQAKSKQRSITITMNAASRVGALEISVSDSGPGVSDSVRENLFSPLKSSKGDGLGLGLSLCSSIIHSHGGEIWLESSLIPGAKFVFTLPIYKRMEDIP